MAAMEKYASQAHVRAWALFAPRDDGYIERGWVRVDGVVVSELGARAFPDQVITLERAAQARQTSRVTILINKPVGYVSGQAEKGYTPAVALIDARSRFAADRAPQRFERGHLDGLAVAGRLDIDSQGLLVLTQDGRIAKQLIGEDSEVDKEYLVRVQGSLSDRGLELLNHGLSLDGKALRPAGALAEQRPAALRAARGQEASDPPHVRAGRPQGGGPEARAHRPRGAGRPAAGAVALSARGRALLGLPRPGPGAAGPYPHTDFSVCFQRAVIS